MRKKIYMKTYLKTLKTTLRDAALKVHIPKVCWVRDTIDNDFE